MPDAADPELLLFALRTSPPHEDAAAFTSLLALNSGEGTTADKLLAWLRERLRPGDAQRLLAWQRLTRLASALPSAELHAVRARLEVAWPTPDPLQRDILGTLADLAELAEARETGLPVWAHDALVWLVDRSRPPRWAPDFAAALTAVNAPRVSEVGTVLEERAATMPRVSARVELDVAAAMLVMAGLA